MSSTPVASAPVVPTPPSPAPSASSPPAVSPPKLTRPAFVVADAVSYQVLEITRQTDTSITYRLERGGSCQRATTGKAALSPNRGELGIDDELGTFPVDEFEVNDGDSDLSIRLSDPRLKKAYVVDRGTEQEQCPFSADTMTLRSP